MYVLYGRPGSGNFVVEAALRLAGVEHRLETVPRGEPSADYLKISPLGQVPALVLSDGEVVTESTAMCLLLAENHPEAGLGPLPGHPDRPQFLRWMTFFSAMMYPTLLRYFYAQRLTMGGADLEDLKEAAVRECDKGYAVLEAHLAGRDWMIGDRRSIADVYLLMLAYWHPLEGRPRDEWINIRRVCAKLTPDPVLGDLNSVHELW
ncbi:MAG: glutathione S-transferase family protein [Rhizobiaceae bacterium]